ncbi:MAG TPA: glycosyl hydrolase family 5 [Hyphomicrobiaceae bacterium]|jgi:hypothetical protein|nr:glycosyl hydrolase family 5 [Hyphomicrobiaceae bacterium]
MLAKLTLVASVAAAGAFFVPHAVSAATLAPSAATTAAGNSLVQHVQWRHCSRWNRECRRRWGAGWRYRRCMRRHGC